jgi:hypothetical protein
VIGIVSKAEDDNLRAYDIVAISALVAGKVYSKFSADLWSSMLKSGDDGWKIFEAYTRQLMTLATKLFGRQCVGKSHHADLGNISFSSTCRLYTPQYDCSALSGYQSLHETMIH